MSQPDPKVRHQVQILQEGVDGVWLFDFQTNVPRLGEYVTIFDGDGDPILEGRVADVSWAYIEDDNGSSCTVVLRAEKG